MQLQQNHICATQIILFILLVYQRSAYLCPGIKWQAACVCIYLRSWCGIIGLLKVFWAFCGRLREGYCCDLQAVWPPGPRCLCSTKLALCCDSVATEWLSVSLTDKAPTNSPLSHTRARTQIHALTARTHIGITILVRIVGRQFYKYHLTIILTLKPEWVSTARQVIIFPQCLFLKILALGSTVI